MAPRSLASDTGNGEALHPHGRGIGAVTENEIVGRRERAEDLLEVPRDCDLAHRVGEFAVLDPESGYAAAVIAGDRVCPHADQNGNVETFGDVGGEIARCRLSRFEMEVGSTGRRRG